MEHDTKPHISSLHTLFHSFIFVLLLYTLSISTVCFWFRDLKSRYSSLYNDESIIKKVYITRLQLQKKLFWFKTKSYMSHGDPYLHLLIQIYIFSIFFYSGSCICISSILFFPTANWYYHVTVGSIAISTKKYKEEGSVTMIKDKMKFYLD